MTSQCHYFHQSLDFAYREVVHWRKNCFEVPRGSIGKQFVSELARLFRAVGEGSAFESITLKAMLVASVYFIVTEASRTSKPRDHSTLLERRLSSWHEGNIEALVIEGRTIQAHLPRHLSSALDTQMARSFAKLMFEGKTNAAIKLITGYK